MNPKKILIIIVIIAVVFVYLFPLVKPFSAIGESMTPNFKNGEYVFIDRYSAPQRGDAIVFYLPENPKFYYLKRVIGLPGETIKIADNNILLFNKENPRGLRLNEESYLRQGEITKEKVAGNEYIKLGTDEYYVLGDNRENSSDSREWGPLKKEFIVGKVFIKV